MKKYQKQNLEDPHNTDSNNRDSMSDKRHILSDTFKKLLTTRNDEQTAHQELNERFAIYIEKIRSLEKQNQTLEGELRQLRGSESKHFIDLYEEEIEKLRNQLDTQNHHSSRLELQLEDQRDRLEKAISEKEDAEKKLASLKEDMDAPTLASKVLQRNIETLREEISFQKKLHEEEIRKLKNQMQEAKGNDQSDGAKSDLSAVLRGLRTQFQDIAKANVAETDEWYKSKVLDLNETVNKNNQDLKKARQENNDLRHQIQNKICEISSLKGTNEALKNQIKEMEEYHKSEAASLQEIITRLEADYSKMENEMEFQLHENQDLLKVKVALDVEIATYRKLLEGEESRIEPSGSSSSKSRDADTEDSNDSDRDEM